VTWAGGSIAVATVGLRSLAAHSPTTIALGYLLVVLFVAAYADLWVAIAASAAAMLCFNFFFLPPVGTFTIADPQNWVALVAFLVVSVVASNLSTSARARATEALERRREVSRLFDLTRDILLTTEQEGALAAVARHVARRFNQEVVAICLPGASQAWEIHHGGEATPEIAADDLSEAYARARGTLEFDARTRAYVGHRQVQAPSRPPLMIAPIRLGTRAIGLLALGGVELDPGTRDAVAGIVAIAIERHQFLAERRASELARQRAQLSSALLASLSHDLRTPLTAIRTAVANLDSPALEGDERKGQARVAMEQLDRLQRLFDEILDMARIEAHSVEADRHWVTPADIVDAAVSYAGSSLDRHVLQIDARDDTAVEADPRLTSSALAHLLENAAAYSPPGATIEVRGWTDERGARITVRDHGQGLAEHEIEHLFEPFYRGERARQLGPGTGMGLAITRGLLAVEGGRVWGENIAGNGAQFTIAVPGSLRPVSARES
jgi:two-component system sensor histidine kinase KdpD